jgi:TRAP transporter TAXI family solute receptor
MRKLLLGLAGAIVFAAAPATAETYNLTVAGASPSGLWSLLGAGIDRAVKAEFPGSSITYQTSGGGLANVGLVTRGKVQMAIGADAELKLAVEGKKPFKKPVKSLRAIAYMYNWAPQHLILSKSFADKYGIKTLADIKAKKAPVRVAVNKRGNIVSAVGLQLMAASGITVADLKKWGGKVIYAASREQGDLMTNHRIDMINNSLFIGHSSLRKIAQSMPIVLISAPENAIAKVSKEAGVAPYTIKAGSYKGQTADVRTVTVGAGVFVDAKMDDKTAYDITRAMLDHIDQIRGVHKAMKALTPQVMASFKVIPYHPGAIKAYREKGLMK